MEDTTNTNQEIVLGDAIKVASDSKNFNAWNNQKILTDSDGKNKWSKPGYVFWASLGINIGTEENGKGEKFLRPIIVLKMFGKNSVLIVPLTSSKKENKFHFYIDKINETENYAILSQIKTIDTKRLIEKVVKIDNDRFLELKKAIANMML